MKALEHSLHYWLSRLYERQSFGIKPGLDMTCALLDALGNPQKAYPIIHVAGTNGKGSVCAMLAAVLSAQGCRTGLYTSPHLVDFNERMVFDNKAISDHELAVLVHDCDKAITVAEKRLGYPATFFEVTTVMALEWFRRKGAQWAVIETGMGGRLDSTNAVVPEISVITSIALDHQLYLGSRIEQIAFEKAGIIKDNIPIVTGKMTDAALDVIRVTAVERCAEHLHAPDLVKCCFSDGADYNKYSEAVVKCGNICFSCRIPFAAQHQVNNLQTAIAVLFWLVRQEKISLEPPKWYNALSAVQLPARCQMLESGPPPLWVDGGHNAEASNALADVMKRIYPDHPLALVLGISADKDVEDYLAPLKMATGMVWVTSAENERVMPVDKLAERVRHSGLPVLTLELKKAVHAARKWADSNNGVVVVCGSLFLAGDFLRLRQAARMHD